MHDLVNDMEVPEKERPNKSQLKREAQALLNLAKKLVELRQEQWVELSLPESVVDALAALQDMHQFGARKRQCKLIGKLLRDVDVTLAEQMMTTLEQKSGETNAAFHQIERWRDRLLTGDGDVLTAFIAQHGGVDVQQLRRLVRSAKREQVQGETPKSARLLFQLIKQILD